MLLTKCMEMNMGKAANNIISKPFGKNFRYERKFVFEGVDLERIISQIVFSSPYGFNEIYEQRTINNIYFDDFNNSFYKENVSGDGWRKKYRLRWYGENFFDVRSPVMEIKKKYGEVGDKISYPLKKAEIDLRPYNSIQINSKIGSLIKEAYPELIQSFYQLTPKLYNSYERRYFLSSCARFRITLDFNLKYFNPNYRCPFNENEVNKKEVILELKYDTNHDDESRILSQKIGARLSKNSKYVRGFEIVHG